MHTLPQVVHPACNVAVPRSQGCTNCSLTVPLCRTQTRASARNCKDHPFNPLTPNDHYRGRTAPLTSKRCILYIYSKNIVTEYFKHGIYSFDFILFKMQFVS